ncbi:GGDEF family protein [Desulfocucumis palustris]|uniref:GGDEF family protein n=1 Tax=Desulfocucumis palustris TaxID=1898651 RepID=A0A2L2XC70_9FIRM|nr:diguanylate cyclase [Desulfocucumis palustris]GBF33594.1 GGDEF family protein [Desulfocucumis palustris]
MNPELIDFILFIALFILFIYVMASNKITILHKAFLAFHSLMMLWPACNFFINVIPRRGYQWFFLNVAFVGLCFLGFGWLMFSLVLIKKTLKKTVIYLLLVPAVLCSILVTTNPWHFLFTRPVDGDWAVRTYGPFFWVFVASNIFYLVMATVLMLKTMKLIPDSVLEKQLSLCLKGVVLLLLFSLADLVVNVVFFPMFGVIPGFTSAGIIVSALCFILAIKKYDLFRIVNIARQEVIDSMGTGIIVLDRDDIVLGLNRSAKRLANIRPGQILDMGKTLLSPSVSGSKAGFLERFAKEKSKDLHTEITLMGENIWHISINVSPLLDEKNNLLGRIVSLSDVTELRSLLNKVKDKNIALQHQNKELMRVQEELFEANKKLEHMTITDELTGCYNRRYLLQQLTREIAMAQRYGSPFSIFLCDLDNFKTINDTYGHLAGDEVLRMVVGIVRDNLRRTDVLARFGGEEFIIFLPHTDCSGADFLAEKIRAAVEAQAYTIADKVIGVTVSIGLVCVEHGLEADREPSEVLKVLLARADKALYQAKEKGRNRVAVAG